MALTAGTRLGPYEITAQIGVGGMGEVYRATDLNLGRHVAIKVLPDAFAQDAERLARFEREAKALASLNHPNIAIIHGFEKVDGIRALVMELVEGPTLAERIGQGPIPIDEGLAVAEQIAEALEAAHEQGVIHRDLKPANIKLRPDRTVKVLDFGLAKVMEPVGTTSAGLSQSPTVTTPAMTQAGMIFGTAAYMSPEQARGKPVDARTDIWAFGCVVYEMLTGRTAFGENTVSDTVAKVLTYEPDWRALPQATSGSVRRMLSRCLAKDPRQRLRDIADARLEIAATDDVQPTATEVAKTRQALRLTVDLGAGTWLSPVPLPFGSAFGISPDGTAIAFVGQQRDREAARIYVRRLHNLQPTALPGTVGANVRTPFFSPDGRWIGYCSQGKLRKTSVNGGVSTALADAPAMPGACWGGDGAIVFPPDLTPGTTLWRVSSDGGKAHPLTFLVEGAQIHAWPQILPGNKAVLYTSSNVVGAFNDAQLVVQSLTGSPRKVVHRGGFHGRYLSSGHLVYIHNGTMFAASFDLDRLEIMSEPVPVLTDVASSATSGGALFSVADNGILVYVPGQSRGLGRELHLMDRDGKSTPLRAAPMNWFNLMFSRDGQRLAMEIQGESSDIWVYELARDTLTRVTSGPSEDTRPVWTPDDRRIVFSSTRGGTSATNLYWQRADGGGEAERLTESTNHQRAGSFHPSGRFLAFDENDLRNYRVMILPMNGDDTSGWTPGTPRVFLDTPFFNVDPMFSPDGQWIAYVSNESGLVEVHVAPFPGPGPSVQVSAGGGGTPTWSRAKQQLFYEASGQIMVAAYTVSGDAFHVATPQPWSDARYEGEMTSRGFDLHPDGARFALSPDTRGPAGARIDKMVFVSNFFDELRRAIP